MEKTTVMCRRQFADGTTAPAETALICQTELEIFLNTRSITRLSCTDTFPAELAVGHLLSEGFLQQQRVVSVNEDNGQVFVTAEHHADVPVPPADLTPEDVFRLADAFQRDSRLHRDTQGVHCCYLAFDGSVVFHAEDMSRHNALDKALGYAVLHHLPKHRCILYSTGRVPRDVVQKMLLAGFPVLAAKGVPTFDAVELARQCGLRLICRAWPDSYDDYG